MKTMSDTRSSFLLLRGGFIFSFVLVGLYYELGAAVSSLYLTGLLLWQGKRGSLRLRVNHALLAAAISVFYLISTFWAVDRGLALWGAVKYLPVVLFALCLMQLSPEQRGTILGDIPWIGGAMTLVTFVLQFVPAFASVFSVAGRLAGFFQYPNTFACFLLLGVEILLTEKQGRGPVWIRSLCGAIVLFGLVQAGSRTIFIFAVPAVLACLMVQRAKKTTVLALCSVCGGLALSAVAIFMGSGTGAGRVLEISTGASTLLGRLLYWKDALPVIAKHPLGLGYLGYYFTQGSFQTGVYSVRWVHNDFLQLLLDVGWVPGILAVIAAIRSLASKQMDSTKRIVLLTLLAHCMVDFDLEFVSMYFVILLCLDWEDKKQHTFRVSALSVVLAIPLCVGSTYIGIVSTLTYSGNHALASAWYPWNTLSNMALLTQVDNSKDMDALADRILAQNDQIALAWDAKAHAAYSRGDFTSVITAKRQAISLARYSLEEYEDYFELLASAVELYRAAGDLQSAEFCIQEIRSIQTLLDEVASQTDPLAWRLTDLPQLEMPEQYTQYLDWAGLAD